MKFLLFFYFMCLVFSIDPIRFKGFLMNCRSEQCKSRPEQPPLPKSYLATRSYFDAIPKDMRIPPSRNVTSPVNVPSCPNNPVPAENMNQYQFETELFLTVIGLDIYDGALHSMAISLPGWGEINTAYAYHQTVILEGRTCQLGNIKGSNPCQGIIVKGQCTDPMQNGRCGFCYGTDVTLDKRTAWTFRLISDYWDLDKTTDARCPEGGKRHWTWNDYRPVLGENAWANLIGPLQVAYQKAGSVFGISQNDVGITLAVNFLDSLPSMIVPNHGCVYYSPKNNLAFNGEDDGFTISMENNISLLSGLKMILQIFKAKSIYVDRIGYLEDVIRNLTNCVKDAYDPNSGFFRQGATYDYQSGQWKWVSGLENFAVDVQTWIMTVIGPKTVDSWFGNKAALNIWQRTKEIGGYKYSNDTKQAAGLGYSDNRKDQVLSGEWTLGGINMLKVFANAYNDPKLLDEANQMRKTIEFQLTETVYFGAVKSSAVKYASKRYWIPFGWWANPLPSMASTTWSIFVDSDFNPFYLGGAYSVY